jgi:hypothetical protein
MHVLKKGLNKMDQPRKKAILFTKSKCTIPLKIPVEDGIDIVPVDCAIVSPIKKLVEMGHRTSGSCSGLSSEHPKNYNNLFYVAFTLPKKNPGLYKACLIKSAQEVGLKIVKSLSPDHVFLEGKKAIFISRKSFLNISEADQVRNIMKLNHFVVAMKENQCVWKK